MAAKSLVLFLIGMMLLTGVCNTLLTKYQDMQCVQNCESEDPRTRKHFEQPVIQTLQMFIGEMGCWLFVAYYSCKPDLSQWLQKIRFGQTKYRRLSTSSDSESLDGPIINIRSVDDGEDRTLYLNSSSYASTTTFENSSQTTNIKHSRAFISGWKILLIALPACCDIAGTTLMNVGLLFVSASIYQMTRGALVLFVGLFSVLFLRRRLGIYRWFALFVVVIGVGVVGLSGAISKDPKATPSEIADHTLVVNMPITAGKITTSNMDGDVFDMRGSNDDFEIGVAEVLSSTPLAVRTIIGVLVIACAQIFTAVQFVLEESIMEKYELQPLKAVGWEGVFGFSVTLVGMLVLHVLIGRTPAGKYGYFDAVEGLGQVFRVKSIAVSSLLIMMSIGGFNYFGLSVTRSVSATSRSTIDTCRTLFIWIVSLGLQWETFKWLQVVGFALLVYGTFLFNDLIRPPLKSCVEVDGEEDLLPEGPIEHS